MLCDHCGDSEAVIHLTQIVNNEMSTFHVCDACAAQKGLEPGASAGDLPLTEILEQMGARQAPDTATHTAACSFCAMELSDFKKTGRLGCPQCYVALESHLRGLLRRLHGDTQHVGKVYLPPDPTESQRLERLSGLQRKLDRAVASEDFERAAQIRDQIRALETV